MPTPRPKNHKRSFIDVKLLLLSGALVATLGLWGFFSHLDNRTLASAAPTEPPQAPDPAVEASHTLTLDLPPMPTLIPPLAASADTSSSVVDPAAILAAPTPVPVVLPAAPKPAVKIFLGGSKPTKGKSAGTPITTTRSSR